MNTNDQNKADMTLEQLILTLPFKEETRDKLLKNLDKLTLDQRYHLADLCWEVYELIYLEERQYKFDHAINEMAKGGTGYTPSDFSKIGEEILQTFTQKLEKSEEVKKLEEIRNQLKTATSQPKSTSTPKP